MTERTIDLIDTYCGKCEFAKDDLDAEPCRSCIEAYNKNTAPPFFEVKKSESITNYDRIRNMSVEEMAKFLLKVHCDGFVCGVRDNNDRFPFNKEWLESELEAPKNTNAFEQLAKCSITKDVFTYCTDKSEVKE